MKSLYIKEPIVTPYNFEHILIQAKEYVRSIVNHWQEQKLTLLGSSALKVYIEEKVANSKILLLEETGVLQETFKGETYLRVMYYPELEEMVRIEGEYWVIRSKLPTLIFCEYREAETYVGIRLPGSKKAERILQNYPTFNFRGCEQYIAEKIGVVERVTIQTSSFKEDNNLVALFKVK